MEKRPMSPMQFANEMRECFPEPDYYEETAHVKADALMMRLLMQLGYEEGVEVFRKAKKWYS